MHRKPCSVSTPLRSLLPMLLLMQACQPLEPERAAPQDFASSSAPLVLLADGSVTITAQNAIYPATEQAAFQIREGAFFGTIFGDNAVAPGTVKIIDPNLPVRRDGTVNYIRQPETVRGSVFPNMYACWDTGWDDAVALKYMLHRLCAVSDADNCAATAVGACNPRVVNAVCQVDTAPFGGLGDFEECSVGGRRWNAPMTTFLNAPCDMSIQDEAGALLCLPR